MYFIWKDTYSTNIDIIDNQHKKLFDIGKRISDLILSRDENDTMDEILLIFNELEKYTFYHFRTEDKFMAACDYNEIAHHRMEHALFAKKVKRMKTNTKQPNPKAAVIELIEFVSDWIIEHILKSDMRFCDDYLNMEQ